MCESSHVASKLKRKELEVMSSFTTLNDDNVKSAVTAQMITPPMSGDESSTTTTPSSLNSPSESKPFSRDQFVDSLISAASILIESIWSTSKVNPETIRWFLKETLRRSRSSYCTLQVALYYIYKLKSHIERSEDVIALKCPRRCFLTCLILSSKFLQDRNYSMKTWSKISGLPLKELTKMEFQILTAMDYNLNVKASVYEEWAKALLVCTYIQKSDAKDCDYEIGHEKPITTMVANHDARIPPHMRSATLYTSKRQQLAQVFVRFNSKVSINATNALSNLASKDGVAMSNLLASSKSLKRGFVEDDDSEVHNSKVIRTM